MQVRVKILSAGGCLRGLILLMSARRMLLDRDDRWSFCAMVVKKPNRIGRAIREKSRIAALAGCTVRGKRRGRRKGAVQAHFGEGDKW